MDSSQNTTRHWCVETGLFNNSLRRGIYGRSDAKTAGVFGADKASARNNGKRRRVTGTKRKIGKVEAMNGASGVAKNARRNPLTSRDSLVKVGKRASRQRGFPGKILIAFIFKIRYLDKMFTKYPPANSVVY